MSILRKTLLVALILLNSIPAYAITASWYSEASLIKEGTRKIGERMVMANGNIFKDEGLTCATWDYPIGVYLRVRNNNTNKFVVVKVTDRTNRRFKGKRIDLSKGAFGKLTNNQWTLGIVPVTVEVIK